MSRFEIHDTSLINGQNNGKFLSPGTVHPTTILLVDDEADILTALRTILSSEGYHTLSASNGEEAWLILQQTPVDLLVTDIRMPGMDGIELVNRLKPRETGIEVLMVTGLADLDLITEAMRLGVYDYLVKPFGPDRLLNSVSHALERRRLTQELKSYQKGLQETVAARTAELESTLAQLEASYRQTIFALGAALETRDLETEAHAYRVMLYGRTLATKAGVLPARIKGIEYGLYLHDIGKIAIPDAILKKEGALTSEEWEHMRRHPDIGRRLLETIDFLHDAKEIVYSHHERWDGSGYPRGLKGHAITFGARVFSLVDTFDAMTSDRPYRKALPLDRAYTEIKRCVGTQFDPDVASVFLEIPPETWLQCRKEALQICYSIEQKRNGLT